METDQPCSEAVSELRLWASLRRLRVPAAYEFLAEYVYRTLREQSVVVILTAQPVAPMDFHGIVDRRGAADGPVDDRMALLADSPERGRLNAPVRQ